MPMEGGARVAIVEGADRMNEDAQNALLKDPRGTANRGSSSSCALTTRTGSSPRSARAASGSAWARWPAATSRPG